MKTFCRLRSATAVAALWVSSVAAQAQEFAPTSRNIPPSAEPACVIPGELAQFEFPLARIRQRIASHQSVKIVAIGSSSTFGEGASSPEWSYPNRLRLELLERFPGQRFTVVNRGVSGDNDHDKRARFARDVIAEKPDSVLWQLGTNSMLDGDPMETHLAVLQGGVTELRRATRADIILIDPQYAPNVLRGGGAGTIVELIEKAARGTRVNLFRRYELMRRWHEVEQIAFEKFISSDELHMNDWSYACVARALANAIADAAKRASR